MSDFKKYRRTAIAEMREIESIEIDWFHERGEMIFYLDSDKNNEESFRVSISNEDLIARSPKIGDKIARNPDNHRDQWLVAEEYFKKNFTKDISDIAAEHRDRAELTKKDSDPYEFLKIKDLTNALTGDGVCTSKEIDSTKKYSYPGFFTGIIEIENGHVVLIQNKLEDHKNNESSFDSALKGNGFDFGHAIAAAKAGKRVARSGWNGSGMFAFIVPADDAVMSEKLSNLFPNSNIRHRSFWALKTAQGDVAPWAPSGSDSLAEDWMILD